MSNPKMFISYSWSSPEHQAWVIGLAEELTGQGVEIVLDKWDLQPGHDAMAFMEGMVTNPDVTKVLLICDRKYAEKANTRTGGAGTEAQIITPEIYAKSAQDKFVAVIREKDEQGKPLVPVFYKNRIFIDLSDEATYASEFERLLRWAWNKPLYERPLLGKKPSFLEDDVSSVRMATSVQFRRAIDLIKNQRDGAVPAAAEYFQAIVSQLEVFRLKNVSSEFDEQVVKSIADFLHYRNEIMDMIVAIASYNPNAAMVEVLHRFLEGMLKFTFPPEALSSWSEIQFDNLQFIVHESFLLSIATLIKHERFVAANYLIETEYYCVDRTSNETMRGFVAFCPHLKSLETRNARLRLQRNSLHADMLMERAKSGSVDFKYLMVADFVLWLRGRDSSSWRKWWPYTLVFASSRSGIAFEMFARAKSAAYFDKIKPILGVADKVALEQLIDQIQSTEGAIPNWNFFDRLNPRALMNLDAIGSTR
jgi:hypothetical protein